MQQRLEAGRCELAIVSTPAVAHNVQRLAILARLRGGGGGSSLQVRRARRQRLRISQRRLVWYRYAAVKSAHCVLIVRADV